MARVSRCGGGTRVRSGFQEWILVKIRDTSIPTILWIFLRKLSSGKKNQVVYLYIEIRTPRQLYLNWCQFVKIPSFTSPGFDSTEDAPRRPGSFLQDAEILEILPMYLGNNSWRSRITVTRETKKSPKNLRKLWNYTPFCCKPTAKRHHWTLIRLENDFPWMPIYASAKSSFRGSLWNRQRALRFRTWESNPVWGC